MPILGLGTYSLLDDTCVNSVVAELLGDETINSIAEVHNVSAEQIILRWNLQRNVVVIPGSRNPDHIKENFDIFGFELSDDEMEQIKVLNRDEKHDWY
ncbi:MAG: aldo/keto reductase [Clostridiales bacterium]|nr:aldo/keto reductase [Clostridiales bacterium]